MKNKKTPKYICEQCGKEVNDPGPYELPDGELGCLDCLLRKTGVDEEFYYDT